METSYIVRLDDACPTNDLTKWGLVEDILDKYDIKPIVCIIPDNQDASLLYAHHDTHFWQRVARWQAKGWHVAMHGCTHKYVTKKRGLIPVNAFSEFAGVDIDAQREKIRAGYSTLLSHGVKPRIFAAPAHSLDKNTLQVLKEETDIRIISDGISYYPYCRNGFLWIPLQLYTFQENVKPGIWTIGFHIDMMNQEQIEQVAQRIVKHKELFTNYELLQIVNDYQERRRNASDHFFYLVFFMKCFVRQTLQKYPSLCAILRTIKGSQRESAS